MNEVFLSYYYIHNSGKDRRHFIGTLDLYLPTNQDPKITYDQFFEFLVDNLNANIVVVSTKRRHPHNKAKWQTITHLFFHFMQLLK